MMTRKDYERIAEALRNARPEPGEDYHADQTWSITAFAIMGALVETNPRFDKDRFIAAVMA